MSQGRVILKLIAKYPVESILFSLLLYTFFANFVNNPIFWFPAQYVKAADILGDIYPCSRSALKEPVCTSNPGKRLSK